ncbi:MAG: chorismate synthase [Bacteroidales bacterium]|nr:chorismate synthase [Bacteroidales bacterium]
MNSYGKNFRLAIFGESHSKAIGIVIDGVMPGISLTPKDFEKALKRRSYGDIAPLAFATTARKESDKPIFLSGLKNGRTTGAPLAILFENKDFESRHYSNYAECPRPSHADFAATVKWQGFNDLAGGGYLSGRLTAPVVAAGVVAKKQIENSIKIKAHISEIYGSSNKREWKAILEQAASEGDSVGGVIRCRAEGVPAGLGEPFFNSLESQIAHLAFSIPAVKAISFGNFEDALRSANKANRASLLKGSEYNDLIINKNGTTATNHSGGINGGISNGNAIEFSVEIRPTASIAKPQQTINLKSSKIESLKIKGRHDCCIALRCPVIIEAITAIVLADNLCNHS